MEESTAPHRSVYFTLRSSGLSCSAGLDGPPELFGFSGAQIGELFLRSAVGADRLLRLNQPFYRQSSSIRSLGPSVLRAWGPWGLLFSAIHNFGWGQCTLAATTTQSCDRARARDGSIGSKGRQAESVYHQSGRRARVGQWLRLPKSTPHCP